MTSALIVVDVQNDFCAGGSLAVAGGADVAASISAHLSAAGRSVNAEHDNAGYDHAGYDHAGYDHAGYDHAGYDHAGYDHAGYDHVVATRDHHIDPGAHFSTNPDFATTWPVHCRVGTAGVQFHPNLDVTAIEAVFDKGEYRAAYSGFDGASNGTALADWLHEHAVERVTVVGIATDHCVRATALDAASNGFEVVVELSLTAGVARATTEAALRELADAGVQLRGEPVLP